MANNQLAVSDVFTTTHSILRLIQQSPPHVRPWLRGVEAEAEHIEVELAAASRRSNRRFISWLEAGLEDAEGDCDN